jgi:hypothetical protein
MLLFIARAVILEFLTRGSHGNIFLFQIRDSLKTGGQIQLIYNPQGQGVPVDPQALGSHFVVCYDSQCHGGGIPTTFTRGQMQLLTGRGYNILACTE